jgi:prepilin-type N-terminal cleavage/methylation domain-containing protein
MRREVSQGRSALTGGAEAWADGAAPRSASRAAFSLIEIMVVVGIMGLILVAGIPTLAKLMQKTGMRKVVADVVEVCNRARAQAILRGVPVDLVFYPQERRLAIEAHAGAAPAPRRGPGTAAEPPSVTPSTGQSATIPDDYVIEMLDVNLLEYKDSERVRVVFYPEGKSDELTLILRSPKNEWKKITLEVVTGLASVDDVR